MTLQDSEAQNISGLFNSLKISNVINVGLELLFPLRCVGCGRVDTGWCHVCQAELKTIPITLYDRVITGDIAVASTGIHSGKLQSAVQALKYEGLTMLSDELGDRLAYTLQQKDWSIDTIVPVPLHTTRFSQRGYNQSQLLSEKIEALLNIRCEPNAVTRQRETQSQVGLSAKERLNNMIDAFHANPEFVSGKTLLIIDDVLTTGATLSACAQAALNAGARQIYGLTVTTASAN